MYEKQIEENVSLKIYNTFKCNYKTKYFSIVCSLENLKRLLKYNDEVMNVPKLIIGNGSNILLTKDFDGLVVVNRLKGIEIVNESEDKVWIKANSGEDWHEFVMYTVKFDYYGLENLAFIPGTIGAAPIQNIGAYGVEVKDFLYQVNYLDLNSLKEIKMNNAQCLFAYRDSIFKNELKNKCFITSVVFELNKKCKCFKINYRDIKIELTKINQDENEMKQKILVEIIGRIRNDKFPNIDKFGNAGSFFKNPTISYEKLNELQNIYDSIPYYPVNESLFKVSAGWLIEKAGWKGVNTGSCSVYYKHALIIVNNGSATGQEILMLSKDIKKCVMNIFGILLQEEVDIL